MSNTNKTTKSCGITLYWTTLTTDGGYTYQAARVNAFAHVERHVEGRTTTYVATWSDQFGAGSQGHNTLKAAVLRACAIPGRQSAYTPDPLTEAFVLASIK